MSAGRLMAGVLIVALVGLETATAFGENTKPASASLVIQVRQARVDPHEENIAQAAQPPSSTHQAVNAISQFGTEPKQPVEATLPSDTNPGSSAEGSAEAAPNSHPSEQQPTVPELQGSGPQNFSDPLGPLNHKVLKFNANVDDKALHPVANEWAKVVPKPARQCIHHFFDNVGFVPRLTNAMFQLKMKDAGGELARFAINSTVGVAGLFDPADKWLGLKEHDNDFGNTLAVWGMSGGWFVVVPVAGPVNVRNALGHFVDGALNPMNYLVPGSAEIYTTFAHSIEGLNERAATLDKFEGVPRYPDKFHPVALDTPDLYEAVRANFLQKEKQREPGGAPGVGAATAGAAVAGETAGGSDQAGAAAVGAAASGAAKAGE
jgi:phospholipid-binding lipoprotein MlaA